MILKLTDQLINAMRNLNHLFFFCKDESFISDFNSNALIISQATDKKIRKQINRIERKLNKISAVMVNETQTEPLNPDSMNEKTVEIIFEHSFISGSITLRSKSKESRDYTEGLIRIQTALKSLARAIDKYNEIAVTRNWPIIQSLYDSKSIAIKRIDDGMSDLIANLEEK
jgi:hypothetical protein